ncbi:type II toxin-antitoxin system VapC family toxin [Acidisoma silvae]|uniref:Type II toxin-antitoxin system VapC family toxin n=1 Tax=Acidisoma silvae TaxID=2802396 RepID=A0A963YQV7_9PROT|nr:type II toxin-antitoxin system VapC family toxin [Acidisoma silvae]MCB8874989.1 type II toxin-antitoxin system VapC family toxin [Acidisoma silvae]
MKVTVDTNILVRAAVLDDERQAVIAAKLLREAEIVAIPLSSLCELVWVLRRAYGFNKIDIANSLVALVSTRNVVINRPAVEAGIASLAAGGDFADGVIAFEGRWLGGDCFVSFDRKAVSLLKKQGHNAALLA